MNKYFKTFILVLALFVSVFVLSGCEKKEEKKVEENKSLLKNNREEAETEVKTALQYYFDEIYKDKIEDARIYVNRIYSSTDEAENEVVKDMKLGDDEVLFQITYEIKPVNNSYITELTIPDGEYDEESGWIINLNRFGVLTPNNDANQKYKVKNFGTGL